MMCVSSYNSVDAQNDHGRARAHAWTPNSAQIRKSHASAREAGQNTQSTELRAGARGKRALAPQCAGARACCITNSTFQELWGLMWGRTNLIYTILLFLLYYFRLYGGATGIRTLETVSRLHTFQACAFDHSATAPLRGGLD